MFKDAALTCFSRGRTVAMVVDIGEHFTRCCGVLDGFIDRENVVMQRFGAHRIRSLALQKCIIPAIHGHEMKLSGCVGFSLFLRVWRSRRCRKMEKFVCSIRLHAMCARKCAYFWNSYNRGVLCRRILINLRLTSQPCLLLLQFPRKHPNQHRLLFLMVILFLFQLFFT